MLFLPAEIILWTTIGLLACSYAFYPLLLQILAHNKKQNDICYSPSDQLPGVSIVIAVYNEERVIRQKLESVLNSHYPIDKIELLIGSDQSTDATNDILKTYADRYPQIRFYLFERQGKANILNRLVPRASYDLLIFTDANVIFSEELIFHLVKHFKNPLIGQVGANIINVGIRHDGISFQEKTYIQRETLIKYHEGIIWGCSMGAFGACYALRKTLFRPIPQNFLMEDFYLSMHVLEKQHKTITELRAIAYEDVSNEIKEEFKRKVRISAGNFQNLSVYKHLLLTFPRQPGFSLLFHKVIRWLGPFLIALMMTAAAILAFSGPFYKWFFFLLITGIGSMFVEPPLSRLNLHLKWLRFISYFCWMNVALFVGWLQYVKGVKSNVWQPTKRNT